MLERAVGQTVLPPFPDDLAVGMRPTRLGNALGLEVSAEIKLDRVGVEWFGKSPSGRVKHSSILQDYLFHASDDSWREVRIDRDGV